MRTHPAVSLRALTIKDAVSIAGWAVDPIVCQAAGWTVGLAPSAHLAFQTGFIVDPPTDLIRLGALLDGRLVGYLALQGIELKWRELGFVVGGRALWGRGLGTAAASAGLRHGFATMGLSHIWAEALDANAASVRILERLGMRETGLGSQGRYLGQASHYRQFVVTSDAGLPPLVTVAPTLILGGAPLTPFLFTATAGTLLAPSTFAFLAWAGLIGTALAYAAFATGLRRTTAATAGTLSLAEPLTAAALGIIVLGEDLTFHALVGCLVLVAGLVVVSVHPRRRPITPASGLVGALPVQSNLDSVEMR